MSEDTARVIDVVTAELVTVRRRPQRVQPRYHRVPDVRAVYLTLVHEVVGLASNPPPAERPREKTAQPLHPKVQRLFC